MNLDNTRWFLTKNADNFPPKQRASYREQLETADEYILKRLLTIEFDPPRKMIWISLFLGMFGVDRYILEEDRTWIAKAITLGGFGIWWLVDLIRIVRRTQASNARKLEDVLHDREYLKKDKAKLSHGLLWLGFAFTFNLLFYFLYSKYYLEFFGDAYEPFTKTVVLVVIGFVLWVPGTLLTLDALLKKFDLSPVLHMLLLMIGLPLLIVVLTQSVNFITAWFLLGKEGYLVMSDFSAKTFGLLFISLYVGNVGGYAPTDPLRFFVQAVFSVIDLYWMPFVLLVGPILITFFPYKMSQKPDTTHWRHH